MNITMVQSNNQPNFKAKYHGLEYEEKYVRKHFGTIGDVYDAQRGEAGLEQFRQDIKSQGDDSVLHIPMLEVGGYLALRSIDLKDLNNRAITVMPDLSKAKEVAAKAVETLKARVGI